MASNIPIIRQIAWISLIPQMILMGIFIFIYHLLKLGDPFVLGALTYLILSLGLRSFIAKYHIKGMKLVKQEQFSNAIPLFEKSVIFFTQNNWVDKYRFFTLLSSSKMTYKEMGLCNIAFCYSQISDGQKAKEYYERTLKEFPNNGLALAGLRMLNSFEQATKTKNDK